MYIKTLVLEDLRSFPTAQFDFTPGINLIAGPNNSGKSSIIKAIYQLQKADAVGSGDIRLTRDFIHITALIDAITPKARRRYFDGRHPLEEGCESCQVTHKIIRHTQERKYTHTVYGKEPIVRDFHGLAVAENEHNFIYPFLSKRKLTNYAVQSSTSNANAVVDTFQNLALKVQKVSNQSKTKAQYESLCRDILGFIVTPITTDTGFLSLGIYSGFGETIPIESMGDGVVNVVGLLSILLTDNDKLFLIEEPESDLHPAALKKLLQLIITKATHNQFIVSTHSNIVVKYLASLTDTRIYYTECSPYDASKEDIPTSTVTPIGNTAQERLWLLENLGYEPFDFELYKGYLILEESTAERMIRDCLIPHFVPDARHLLRTVAAQGASGLETKFEDLQKLFLYLHLSPVYENRAWVIADGDKPGLEALKRLRTTFRSWDAGHFSNWERTSFEDYYPSPFQRRATEISDMLHGKTKQLEKTRLLEDVLLWFEQDPETAKPMIESSAKEIITKLREITAMLTRMP